MAPLLPSESAAYTVTLPDEVEDDRFNLKVRTGAALTYTRSSVVVHGGLTAGLGLPIITIPEIKRQLESLDGTSVGEITSNEIFYLNIINRKWSRVGLMNNQIKPPPRFYHSLAFHQNFIYLFGGLIIEEDTEDLIPTNDLWQYNIDTRDWICIDDGSRSGSVARYDHSIHVVDYETFDGKQHPAIAITGGRGELNQELTHISIFDLETKSYVDNSEYGLSLNELVPTRNFSTTSTVDPKQPHHCTVRKLKVVSEKGFVISGSTKTESRENDDVFHIFYPNDPKSDITNPLVSLPVVSKATGLRLPLATAMKRNLAAIPANLKYPSGGVFGPNIVVGGNNDDTKEFQIFLFNIPSQKWTRLNVDTKKKATELYLWKNFTWPSHHKVIVLGSLIRPKNSQYATIQTFDLLILVGLPITNIFHAFSVSSEASAQPKETPKYSSLKDNTSFEAYSKYIAPSTKISSIRSVFPNYAVTLGRNAFERFGDSLSDFELITAEGDKVNVPLMLLRKRWGRCFDMLLAKGYARAVYQLENKSGDKEEDEVETDTQSVATSTAQSKKSMIVLNKASQQQDREVPQFRLPFQDMTAHIQSGTSVSPSPNLEPQTGPTSRKASVISTGAGSITTTSSCHDGLDLDFSNLPPLLPPPTDPLPSAEKQSILKNPGSREYLRDSPRGSVSGVSITPHAASTIKLKDLRSSTSSTGRKLGSAGSLSGTNIRSGSLQTSTDDISVHDSMSQMESITVEIEDETGVLLEPLLIPRSLYLPFATATVSAVAEFLFTGQLGDKWLLYPTTTDNFLMAKFYELPLLYDLISEVLYAIIGKKEDALIKDYGSLLATYNEKLKNIFNADESQIVEFFRCHTHVNESFSEIENYLNTVDDGYLNLTLLGKASKVSGFTSATASSKASFDYSRSRRSSGRSAARIGKSSLSKEVNIDDDDDDIDNEDEHDDDDDKLPDAIPNNVTNEPVHFRTESMSSKNTKKKITLEDEDDIGPTTPLRNAFSDGLKSSKTEDTVVDRSKLDDEDPLSMSGGASKESEADSKNSKTDNNDDEADPLLPSKGDSKFDEKSVKSSSENDCIQVPEGRFQLAKGQIYKVKSTGSSSGGENKQDSTSDSDDMAVGLGLISNLRLKEKKKASDTKGDASDDEDLESERNLPTLENLASPDSPSPGDHLLQVIYETAALACDMKLLLRSANVLEMSKYFKSKKDELLRELEVFGQTYYDEKLKQEAILKEQERMRDQEREEERILECQRERVDKESLSKQREERLLKENESRGKEQENEDVFSSVIGISHDQSHTFESPKGPQECSFGKEDESPLNVEQKLTSEKNSKQNSHVSNITQVDNNTIDKNQNQAEESISKEKSAGDVRPRPLSVRNTLSSFRSVSNSQPGSIQNRKSESLDEVEDTYSLNETNGRNPTGGKKKFTNARNFFSSFLSNKKSSNH